MDCVSPVFSASTHLQHQNGMQGGECVGVRWWVASSNVMYVWILRVEKKNPPTIVHDGFSTSVFKHMSSRF